MTRPQRRAGLASLLCLLCLLSPLLGSSAAAEQQGPRILHVPAGAQTAEQGILRPVPIELALPAEIPVRRALLHFKTWGSKEWKTLELRRQGTRYVGAIPCLEVGSLGGEIRYYVRFHDAEGGVVAFGGTRSTPYLVKIHHPSARPDLAGGAGQCPDPADCPPGLPGCPSAEVERVPCRRDADCEGGQTCSWEGHCADDPRRYGWLGLELSQDVGLVATRGACSVASQESAGYACYRELDDAVYTGRPVYTNEPLAVGRGLSRALLSYERLVSYQTTLGVRLGYAFFGERRTLPGAVDLLPFSAEVTARYWLGADPFARRGLRGYVMASGGFSQFDVGFSLHVREDPSAPYTQPGNDLEQSLQASKRAGDLFIALGSGLMYPVSEGFAPVVELRVAQAFPYAATIASASIGVRVGMP
jgi:hypothetical protein